MASVAVIWAYDQYPRFVVVTFDPADRIQVAQHLVRAQAAVEPLRGVVVAAADRGVDVGPVARPDGAPPVARDAQEVGGDPGLHAGLGVRPLGAAVRRAHPPVPRAVGQRPRQPQVRRRGRAEWSHRCRTRCARPAEPSWGRDRRSRGHRRGRGCGRRPRVEDPARGPGPRGHRDDPDEDGARDERRSAQRHVGTLSGAAGDAAITRQDDAAWSTGTIRLSTTVSLRGEPEGMAKCAATPSTREYLPPSRTRSIPLPKMPVMHGRYRSTSSTTCFSRSHSRRGSMNVLSKRIGVMVARRPSRSVWPRYRHRRRRQRPSRQRRRRSTVATARPSSWWCKPAHTGRNWRWDDGRRGGHWDERVWNRRQHRCEWQHQWRDNRYCAPVRTDGPPRRFDGPPRQFDGPPANPQGPGPRRP